MKFGEAIRLRVSELCRERGITVNGLANLCGITQSTLSNIIGGRNQSTTVATVKKLCDGLGLSLSEFFDAPVFSCLEQELQ
ncbi:MAG: helix-turn-helix transcriptional regulator [Clostridia bacterium]|nr:helix-turn-helix transcriptional regulator [Clostridia bacterium]